MNKKFFSFILASLLLMSSALINSSEVFGWGSTGGDGTLYRPIQETAVFLNNSGSTLSAGDVVILDTAGSGLTAGTTLGAYITTTTGADSIMAVGVVKSTSVADDLPVVVVTKGVVDTKCHDSTDGVTVATAVGTATSGRACGGGTNLGVALEAGAGYDEDYLFIWVDPTGAD